MRFGSLFAGIGGIDLGLERAGMECAWQVEIDPFCRKVLTKHWPDVPKFEDALEVGSHNLERVDLIAGGFPCQDISLAGKGAGIAEGTRSGLWFEYLRIIRELRPRYVLVENVSALLVRGLDRVLGDLATSGYDAEWDCIPAAAAGAPHRRDRVFIVAVHRPPDGNGEPTLPLDAEAPELSGDVADAEGIAQRTRLREDEQTRKRGRRSGHGSGEVPDARRELLEGRESTWADHRSELRRDAEWWATEPAVCRVVDGVSHGLDGYRGRVATGIAGRVDRLRGLGNAVVPQVAEFVGRLIMKHHAQEAH